MLPYVTLFGKLQIPLYGPIFVIGFLLALLIAIKISPQYSVARDDMLYASIFGAIGLLVGAKLLYFITKLPAIIRNFDKVKKLIKIDPEYVLNFAFGGLVFYGGLIGTLIGVYVYCRKYKVNFIGIMDVYAPLLPLVHGFGRIGCFLAGCCYGVEYHGFLSVQFPENDLVPELNAVPRLPVQLIEAGLNFVLFVVLFLVMKKIKLKPGRALGIYLIYYTIARYVLEMFRGDIIRGKVGVLSTSQIISLILLPIGIILIRGKWVEKISQQK